MSRKKEPSERERRFYERQIRREMRGDIGEYYRASVEKIVIEHSKNLSGPDAVLFSSYPTALRTEIFEAADFADFAFDCCTRDCVGDKGRSRGHVLNDVVDAMVHSNETTKAGRSICRAWQDSRRIGRHECLAELTYQVTITYAATATPAFAKPRLSRTP